jgi:hypothetical protein
MRLRAALLRVLLCISLVFNGSVAAATSAMMALQQGQPGMSHATAAHEDPCHGHATGGVDTVDAHQSAQPGSLPARTGQPVPDCCHAGTCGVACMSPAQVQLASHAFDATGSDAMAAVAYLTPRHAEPALPSLIRPPIG